MQNPNDQRLKTISKLYTNLTNARIFGNEQSIKSAQKEVQEYENYLYESVNIPDSHDLCFSLRKDRNV